MPYCLTFQPSGGEGGGSAFGLKAYAEVFGASLSYQPFAIRGTLHLESLLLRGN
jgi:hypothetical protein